MNVINVIDTKLLKNIFVFMCYERNTFQFWVNIIVRSTLNKHYFQAISTNKSHHLRQLNSFETSNKDKSSISDVQIDKPIIHGFSYEKMKLEKNTKYDRVPLPLRMLAPYLSVLIFTLGTFLFIFHIFYYYFFVIIW